MRTGRWVIIWRIHVLSQSQTSSCPAGHLEMLNDTIRERSSLQTLGLSDLFRLQRCSNSCWVTWHPWNGLFPGVAPTGFQLQTIQQCQFLCLRNAWSPFFRGFRRRGGSQESLQVPLPSLLLYTDASATDCGTHLLDLTATGLWSWEERGLHINMLEMKAIQ